MADFPALPLWTDAHPLKCRLIESGWRSPDTYDNCFSPVTEESAIYLFLLHERQWHSKAFVAYVGMSQNLCRRLSGHEILRVLYQPGFWPQRWFLPTPADNLRSLERRYIEQFDPPWNIVGRKRGVVLQ